MVNRVLIRLKVVQLLYSYMLSRSEFKIETPVETSSADRRYSYQAYAELLLLILELSGRKVVSDGPMNPQVVAATATGKLRDLKMTDALMGTEEVRELIAANSARMRSFDPIIGELMERIKNCTAYRSISKRKSLDTADEIALWTGIVRTVFMKTPALTEALHTNEAFTMRGMEMGLKMLLETLGNYSDTRTVLASCRSQLQQSLHSAYELYLAILRLPVEITAEQHRRLAANAAKYLPTDEDLNPDRRFADAALPRAIMAQPQMAAYCEHHDFEWATDPALISRLLDLVIQSEPYMEFMAQPGSKTLEEEAELWRKLLRNIILPSEDLAEALENTNIYWNDDLEVMSSFALKTLRQFGHTGADTELLPEFKDEEDAAFGLQLFNAAVAHGDEYRELIDSFVNTSKWDTERLALMDIVILHTALAEVMEFPKIPLTVTANEYVEIANWYSTTRSGAFINGMLAAITEKLRAEGRIHKSFTK